LFIPYEQQTAQLVSQLHHIFGSSLTNLAIRMTTIRRRVKAAAAETTGVGTKNIEQPTLVKNNQQPALVHGRSSDSGFSASDSGLDSGNYGYEHSDDDDGSSEDTPTRTEHDARSRESEAAGDAPVGESTELKGVDELLLQTIDDSDDTLLLIAGILGFVMCLICGIVMPFAGLKEVSSCAPLNEGAAPFRPLLHVA
jgi:hypothetical protein